MLGVMGRDWASALDADANATRTRAILLIIEPFIQTHPRGAHFPNDNVERRARLRAKLKVSLQRNESSGLEHRLQSPRQLNGGGVIGLAGTQHRNSRYENGAGHPKLGKALGFGMSQQQVPVRIRLVGDEDDLLAL